jgi:superfamily II DNA or RNA helicase
MGILKIATGGGKTWIGVELIRIIPNGQRCIVLVPNNVLISQWNETLKERLGEGHKVTVVTYSSMHNALFGKNAKGKKVKEKRKKLKQAFYDSVFLIVDECHRGGGKQLFKLMKHYNGPWRLGLSATAEMRTDETDLRYISWLGPVVYDMSAKELIDEGVLAKPRIEFLTYEPLEVNLRGEKPGLKLRNLAYETHIVMNKYRNKLIKDVVFTSKGKQIMILVQHIKHGKWLNAIIPQAEFLYGTHNKERSKMEKGFKDGSIRTLIATRTILGEGFDYAGIEILILAGGGKSRIRAIQELGRGLRKSLTKQSIDVYDFADYGMYVYDDSIERAIAWHKQEFDVHGPSWLMNAVRMS